MRQRYLDNLCVLFERQLVLRKLVATHHPSMGQDLLEVDALPRVDVQHPTDEVFGGRRYHVPIATGHRKLALADPGQNHLWSVVWTIGKRSVAASRQIVSSK